MDSKLKSSPPRSRCDANPKGLKGARVCALANGQASSAQKESNAVESSKGTKQRPWQQPGVNKQGLA